MDSTPHEELRRLRDRIGRLQSREAERVAQNSRLRGFLDGASMLLLALDATGNGLFLNRRASALLGYEEEELAGQNFFELFLDPEEARATIRRYQEVMSEEDELCESMDMVLRTRSGEQRTVKWSASMLRDDSERPAGMMFAGEDVTRRRALQARERDLEQALRESQNMESLGTLAGGIAHDFNNILAEIIGYTDLIKRGLPAESESDQHAQEVLKAATRAKDLVRQILTFSRKDELYLEVLDLSTVVSEAMRLLRSCAPQGVEVLVELPDGPASVHADRSQMHQLLMNLGNNALQAMQRADGRMLEHSTLLVTVDFVVPGETLAAEMGDVDRGVRLMMSDTGCGMGREVLDRIFEPFFTTRGVGEGAGLGLAAVHGIVHAHRGTIRVQSEPGKGTLFELVLPLHAGEAQRSKHIEVLAESARGSSGHLLVVDDEPGLIYLMRRQLEEFGFTVDCHLSAEKALEAFRAHPDVYDLVLTDQAMPGMTGMEMCARMHEVRPDLPIVLTTGLGPELPEAEAAKEGVVRVLRKPHSADELLGAIGEVLAMRALRDRQVSMP